MKNYIIIIIAALSISCVGRSKTTVEWRTEADSVSYAIGLNVGENLLRMDSTLQVEALCQAIRDVYARAPRMTTQEARFAYLRYVNVSQPEKIRAYENQFLEDFRQANRTYAINDSGLTYEVLDVGDESNTARNVRDTVAFRYTAKTVAGTVVDSSYERGDTTRQALGNVSPVGLQQAVRLAGQGGRINAWLPSAIAYGVDGNPSLGIGPNETLFYEIELTEVKRRY